MEAQYPYGVTRAMQVVETAPAEGLPPATRQALFDDATRLCAAAKYLCAGTVEFLVDKQGTRPPTTLIP